MCVASSLPHPRPQSIASCMTGSSQAVVLPFSPLPQLVASQDDLSQAPPLLPVQSSQHHFCVQ